MTKKLLEYKKMYVRVFHYVIKEALQTVVDKELVGDHYFRITFETHHKGVILPQYLKAKFPDTMYIDLHYKLDRLSVGEDHFSVALSFQDVFEVITVPYSAIKVFEDPSVDFVVQYLSPLAQQKKTTFVRKKTKKSIPSKDKATSLTKTERTESSRKQEQEDKATSSAKVITLANFRKKGTET